MNSMPGSKFEIVGWQLHKFCVTTVVKNIIDKFVWKLWEVYGCPYDEGKQEFIDELDFLFDNWAGPILLGGTLI